jgi:hypothetical protein
MAPTTDGSESLHWVSHPVREEPRRTWIVALFVGLTAAALWVAARDWQWPAFGAIVLLAAVREWFLPARCALDDAGASRRFLFVERRRPWSAIRRATADRHGVLLSPSPFPSRLETLRGLYLRFSGNREQVLAFVDERLRRGRGETN